jgi:prepilin peptidase CpaA
MDIVILPTLGAALTAACVTDLTSQRIPNVLTYPLMLVGLAYHAALYGASGLGFSAAGLGVGFGLLLLQFMLGFVGAGDVKLLAAVGAWLGWQGVLTAFVFTTLLGGVYGLVVLAFHKGALRRMAASLWTALRVLPLTKRFFYAPVLDGEKLPQLCYAVAIAAGTFSALVYRSLTGGWLLN